MRDTQGVMRRLPRGSERWLWGTLVLFVILWLWATSQLSRFVGVPADLEPASGLPKVQYCDVFISHRGPDTKLKLVSHLKGRLGRANLDVFLDSDLKLGSSAWPGVLAKLRGATRVVLVLSPQFEDSWYCLEELRIAVERRQPLSVLPVFIDREPGDYDDDKLERAFKKLRNDMPRAPASIVGRWRSAFHDVGQITGLKHDSSTDYVIACMLCAALLTPSDMQLSLVLTPCMQSRGGAGGEGPAAAVVGLPRAVSVCPHWQRSGPGPSPS